MSDATPSITFLHGFLGTADDWRPIVDAPEFAAMATHPIDLPVADDWQTGVRAVADSLADETILIGYSMGARLALGCALDAADRVKLRGLILVSGSPGIEDSERVARREHDEAISQQLLGLREINARRDFLDQWYRQPVFADLVEPEIAELVTHRQGFDPQRQSRLIGSYTISKQPDYWPRLKELAMPFLFVAGERDEKYRNIAARIERTRQDSSSRELAAKVVADCGHNVHRQQPAALVQIIREFVASLER